MEKKKLSFQMKIIIGLVSGVAIGLLIDWMGGQNNPFIDAYVLPFFTFLGDLFIKLIRMTIAPLVFFSIVEGVTNLGDINKLRSIGLKTFGFIIGCGAISTLIGMGIGLLFQPGIGAIIENTDAVNNYTAMEMPALYEIILNFFPANPIQSMATNDMMPIISFAIFCGSTLLVIGKPGERMVQTCSDLANLMITIVVIVLKLTPIGAMGLLAANIGKFGNTIIGPFAKFIGLSWMGCFIVQTVLFSLLLFVFGRVNPLAFWKHAWRPWSVGFTTCSSSAALLVSMETAEQMGIPKDISLFVLPIGATAHMNGVCVFGLLTVFAAQMHGIPITLQTVVFIVVQCLVISIGAAALPGSVIVLGIALFSSLGWPMAIVGMAAAVNRIVDPAHTSTNLIGDLVFATVIASKERRLDLDLFNKKKAAQANK